MIDPSDLARLEAAVERALVSGDECELTILGYGEVSLVIGWPFDAPVLACKRLPVFADAASCSRYAAVVDDYVRALHEHGVDVLETEVHSCRTAGGGTTGFVVQPVVPSEMLGPNVLHAATPDPQHPFLVAMSDATTGACSPTLGLDAQLSNWVWRDGRLRYLDVSTPFAWGDDGTLLLDLPVLVQSLPWVMRTPVRRLVLPNVIARYREPRAALLDFCGNLLKERLDAWVPAALVAANERAAPAITESEVHKYYASDARLWDVMLKVRRLDRIWQRKVRRRPYRFLLPGPITR